MLLAKVFNTNVRAWKELKTAIDEFGHASGLFETLNIKRLGRKGAGPLQIHLNYGGPDFNLADVGYGVSQTLPIVLDAVRADRGATLLIQQPEVHLHPRAQAALGSLLLRLAQVEGKRFLVETHSDYMIDRVRMDVRDDKSVSPEAVRILYFERNDGSTVQVCPLRLDDQGNIADVPVGYRRFFLQEERRFIGG
jgi:predicted ATPase